MKPFMDESFLLTSKTAEKLYRDSAHLPIIDYHCHISPKEIAEDKSFENLTQIWLYADHYKWRALRSDAVEEEYITGGKSDFEKFEKWAKTMPKLIGNPLYHWTHLELKRYFSINTPLSENSCRDIWDKSCKILKKLSARKIIEMSRVEIICTTDDPVDSLEYHQAIAQDKSFKTKVLPAFRPDKAINLTGTDFTEYINKLSHVSNIKIDSFNNLKSALKNKIEFFNQNGCKASDHGLEAIPFSDYNEEDVDIIFKKALNKKAITNAESDKYKTALLVFLAKEYSLKNWVMELHYGVIRNANKNMFEALGPDTGFDTIGSFDCSQNLAGLLNKMNENNGLPKTLIFPINPNDNAVIGTVIGCFLTNEAKSKLQQGSAWWFNDTKIGMEQQLKSYASLSVLGNFAGFLTDSRSFLSYTRHEYFRRILCNYVGDLVENGEYPNDEKALKDIIDGIFYYNTKNYFGF